MSFPASCHKFLGISSGRSPGLFSAWHSHPPLFRITGCVHMWIVWLNFIKNSLFSLNSPDVCLVVGMHEDCYGTPRRAGSSLRRHPDPVRCCAVPPATPEVHQVSNIDYDGSRNRARTDPGAIRLLDFEAAQVILKISSMRSTGSWNTNTTKTFCGIWGIVEQLPGKEASCRHNLCELHIL